MSGVHGSAPHRQCPDGAGRAVVAFLEILRRLVLRIVLQ